MDGTSAFDLILANILAGPVTDPAGWHAGLVSSLAMLLVDRLATYTMIQRVRPQAFLPRVVQTWARVFAIVDEDGHWR